jgi:hypothetical protein
MIPVFFPWCPWFLQALSSDTVFKRVQDDVDVDSKIRKRAKDKNNILYLLLAALAQACVTSDIFTRIGN